MVEREHNFLVRFKSVSGCSANKCLKVSLKRYLSTTTRVCNFWFELDHAQTSKVISLLATAAITSSTSVGSLARIKKWSHMFQALTSARTLEFLQPLTSEDSTEFIERNDPFNPQIDIMEAEQAEEELLYMKLQELALRPNLKISEGEDTSLSGVVEDHHVINELTLEDIENPRERWGLEEKRGESPHSPSEQKSGESPRSLTEYQAIIAKLNQEVEELKAFKTQFTEQSKKIDYLEYKLALNTMLSRASNI